VWGSGPRDVWAVGSAEPNVLIFHWDGSTWSASPSAMQVPGSLDDVWGSGPNDVWAVGQVDTFTSSGSDWETGNLHGLLLHWDGTTWSRVVVPGGERGLLTGVWGTGPHDVWVTRNVNGDKDNIYGLQHWDGSAWSPVEATKGRTYRGVWASGPNDV